MSAFCIGPSPGGKHRTLFPTLGLVHKTIPSRNHPDIREHTLANYVFVVLLVNDFTVERKWKSFGNLARFNRIRRLE